MCAMHSGRGNGRLGPHAGKKIGRREFIKLGGAGLAGAAASWGVVRFVMRAEWVLLPGRLVLTVLGCTLLTLICGQVGTWLALRARPAPWLRNE